MLSLPRIFLLLCMLSSAQLWAQSSVSIDISTDPNVQFTFNTIAKLTGGLVAPNAITINIEAVGTRWDLYAGSVTSVPGVWDNSQFYSSSGDGNPPVNLLQLRVHNASNTENNSGYLPLQDVATSTLNIIGNRTATDTPVNCSDVNHIGTNTPGSYLTDPQCYQFRVDLKATPGIYYRPGIYTMELVFIIAPDL